MTSPAKVLAAGLLVAGCALTWSADADAPVAPALVSYDTPYYPPLSGDTQSTLDMINGAMADAGTLYRDAVDPGSESAADVAAATERAGNMGRNSGQLEGYLYEQGVRQDVLEYDAAVQADEIARDAATDAWIDADRAISRSFG